MLACVQGPRLLAGLRSSACLPKIVQICCSSTESDKEPKVYQRPQTMTRAQYDAQFKDDRARRSATADTGIKVTASKRFFLVMTGLYKQSDVPEYISGNMNSRLGDRLRVMFIITFVLLFFTIFLTCELGTVRSIDKGRANLTNKPRDN